MTGVGLSSDPPPHAASTASSITALDRRSIADGERFFISIVVRAPGGGVKEGDGPADVERFSQTFAEPPT